MFTVVAGFECEVEETSVLQLGSPIQLECKRPRGDEVASFHAPNGKQIRASTNDTSVVVEEKGLNTRLTIGNAKFKDAGTYTCFSGMKCKNRTIELYGVEFPRETFEQSQTLNLRMHDVINCTVLSNPRARVEWYFNGIPIKNTKEKYVDKSNLVVKRSSLDDAGNYICRASLPDRNVSRELDIRVDVTKGSLRCFNCSNYNNVDRKSSPQDKCSSSRNVSTTSCFTKCLTVFAKGEAGDGSEMRFVMRDCGDGYSFESNRELKKSELDSLVKNYDVTSITSGRASLCDGNDCNDDVASYDNITGGAQRVLQHQYFGIISYSVVMAFVFTTPLM